MEDDNEHQPKVVFSVVKGCTEEIAAAIYENLVEKQGISNIWLLLDVFYYNRIPSAIRTFKLMATSQQVDLKPQDRVYEYRCLLSAWKRADLFELGRAIYKFTEKEMQDRFYFSGGSVQAFCQKNVADIQGFVDEAIAQIPDSTKVYATSDIVQVGHSQFDRVRHTFVECGESLQDEDVYKSLRFCSHWKHVIDSEYAVRTLSTRLRTESLTEMYNWAIGAGYQSLAGSLFRAYVHSLASDNRLELFVSKYELPEHRKPESERHFAFERLLIRQGSVKRSVSKASEYMESLMLWRADNTLTYWMPDCRNFQNIDCIAKLEPREGTEEGAVTYIQVTIAETHPIDGDNLAELNNIFLTENDTELQLYIALCPPEAACKKLELTPRDAVLQAEKQCQVFVGWHYHSVRSVQKNLHLCKKFQSK